MDFKISRKARNKPWDRRVKPTREMGAVANLDYHEQLMQHGKDDDREKMVWSNREQEETNAYVSPGRQTAAQMHKRAVQFGVRP